MSQWSMTMDKGAAELTFFQPFIGFQFFSAGADDATTLGVKVRNLKMDFNTGGTWRRVGQ